MKALSFLMSLCLMVKNLSCEATTTNAEAQFCQKDGCHDDDLNNLNNLDQIDQELVDIVKKKFLVPPPEVTRQASLLKNGISMIGDAAFFRY